MAGVKAPVSCTEEFTRTIELGGRLGRDAKDLFKNPTSTWPIDQLREMDVDRLEQMVEQKIDNAERSVLGPKSTTLEQVDSEREASGSAKALEMVNARFGRNMDTESLKTLKELARGEIELDAAREELGINFEYPNSRFLEQIDRERQSLGSEKAAENVEIRFAGTASPEIMEAMKGVATGELDLDAAKGQIAEHFEEWRNNVDTAFEQARQPAPEPPAPGVEPAAPAAPAPGC